MDKTMRFSCAIGFRSESTDYYLIHRIVKATSKEEAGELFMTQCREYLGEEYEYCHSPEGMGLSVIEL